MRQQADLDNEDYDPRGGCLERVYNACFGRGNGFEEITMASLMQCARAGDLILIQENVLFDNYTHLNGQVCHVVKQLMRLKVDYQKSVSDFDDPVLCHQWCRVGLICDSPIKDVKYLLEITKDGVEEWELFSRLLMLKSQKKTLGYKQISPNLLLSPETL